MCLIWRHKIAVRNTRLLSWNDIMNAVLGAVLTWALLLFIGNDQANQELIIGSGAAFAVLIGWAIQYLFNFVRAKSIWYRDMYMTQKNIMDRYSIGHVPIIIQAGLPKILNLNGDNGSSPIISVELQISPKKTPSTDMPRYLEFELHVPLKNISNGGRRIVALPALNEDGSKRCFLINNSTRGSARFPIDVNANTGLNISDLDLNQASVSIRDLTETVVRSCWIKPSEEHSFDCEYMEKVK